MTPAYDKADQPMLFPTGQELKTAGMAQAIEAVPTWAEQARAGIAHLAAQGKPFTSETLIDLVGAPRPGAGTNRNNAVGAAFSGAARRRVIQRVGYQQARTASSHARVLAVWVGTS